MSNSYNNVKRTDGRFCDYFNMTPKQWQDYKDWKWQRWIIYIVGMIGASIFYDAWMLWVLFTLLLMSSIWNGGKKEEQWIKDGSIRREDLINR